MDPSRPFWGLFEGAVFPAWCTGWGAHGADSSAGIQVPQGPPAAVLEAAGSVSPARREKRLRRPGRLDPRSPLLSVSLSLLFAKNSFLGQPFETHVIFHQRSVYFRCVSGPVLSWWTGSVLAQPAVCLRPLVSRMSRDPPVGSTGLSGHVSTCSPGGGPGNQGLGASI